MAGEEDIRRRFEAALPQLDEHTRRLWAAREAHDHGYGGVSLVARATGVSRRAIQAGMRELGIGALPTSRLRAPQPPGSPPPGALSPTLPDAPATSAGRSFAGPPPPAARAPGAAPPLPSAVRVRRPGGGGRRPPSRTADLHAVLEGLLLPAPGDGSWSPLRWTSLTIRELAARVSAQGRPVGDRLVTSLLRELGYRIEPHRRRADGPWPPERDVQFAYLNDRVREYLDDGEPVLTAECRDLPLPDEHLGGDALAPPAALEHGGLAGTSCDWAGCRDPAPPTGPALPGSPVPVPPSPWPRAEEWPIDVAFAIVLRPAAEGIYELAETPRRAYGYFELDRLSFVAASIRGWWRRYGRRACPGARRLLLVADTGASGGSRRGHLMCELQRLSNDLRLPVEVALYPAGTCRWNASILSLFSFVSVARGARVPGQKQTVVQFVARTPVSVGHELVCRLRDCPRMSTPLLGGPPLPHPRLRLSDYPGFFWNYTLEPY